MRRVIVVANQKGGVGKTTTVVNLGAALADMGYRVALIDMDTQGALSVTFGVDPYKTSASTLDLLLESSISLSQVLRTVGERLLLAPANAGLLSAEYQLVKQTAPTLRLRNAIERAKDDVDYVLIDTPPNLGLLTVNALVAANELLVPLKAEYLAMRGVRPLLETVWVLQDRTDLQLELLGVLVTQFRPNSRNLEAVVEEIRAVFRGKLLSTMIPDDESAAVSPAVRTPVVDYLPQSPVAVAYKRLAKEVSDALRG